MEGTGLIHIYTGTGKGKTTSAVGLALRALSHGYKVCYSIFNKYPEKYGNTEIKSLEKLGVKIIRLTNEHPSFNKSITKKSHKAQSEKGITVLETLIHTGHFDILIMDEVLDSSVDSKGIIKLMDIIKMKQSQEKNKIF